MPRRLPAEAERLQRYEKVMRVALKEMPLVPLYHRELLYAVSNRIGWEPPRCP